MKWGTFFGTALLVAFILLVLWPILKQKPLKDKIAFMMILLFGWGLSLFDLPNIAGPMTWMRFFFKPFAPLME
ncbi:hypothetical protein [Bacillus benzoevorans]|uniref:Uncharacterized protein n=1 Tax=Bacillus benzoevorans TaxID=1456 RepID=A0A7X0HNZ4_9BACI|nr:hypothetical protein [Bacillus benzoevorans]MBB6444300.1 hypothetical protein [Bacillus benzoevorans]